MASVMDFEFQFWQRPMRCTAEQDTMFSQTSMQSKIQCSVKPLLRWFETVSNAFQDLEFDRSL